MESSLSFQTQPHHHSRGLHVSFLKWLSPRAASVFSHAYFQFTLNIIARSIILKNKLDYATPFSHIFYGCPMAFGIESRHGLLPPLQFCHGLPVSLISPCPTSLTDHNDNLVLYTCSSFICLVNICFWACSVSHAVLGARGAEMKWTPLYLWDPTASWRRQTA